MRCIEGLIKPEPGRTGHQLCSRTELFIGPGYHQIIKDLFAIRSNVEHLHYPLENIKIGKEKDSLFMVQKAFEAEIIARYCLHRIFLTPNLWQYFTDDSSIDLFWRKSPSKRSKIWGEQLDLDKSYELFRADLFNLMGY